MATPREDYIENLKSMGYSQSEAEEKADEDSAYLAIGDSPEADPLPWSDEDEPVDANVDIDADTDVDTDADLISEAAFDAYYDPSPAPGSERSYSYTTDQAKRGALREDVRELAIEEYRSQGYSEQEAEDAADADLLRLSVRGGERLTDEDLERLGRDPELRDIPMRRIIDIDEPDTLELSEVMQRRVDEATSDFRSDKQSRLREQFSEALPDLTLEDIAEAGARALISPIGPGLQTFWGGELEAEQIPIEQEELDERPALQRVAEEFVVPAATALPISLYQAVSPLIDDEESYEERYDLLGEAAAELPQYVEPMPLAHDFLGYQGEVNLPRFIADPINYFDRQYGDIVDAKRRLLLEAMDVDVSPGSEQGQRFQERADLRQLATGIEDLDMLMPQLRESTSREDVDGLIGRLQLRQIPDVLRLEEGRTLDAQALVDAVEQYDIQMPESIVNLRDALEQEADEERIADLLSRVRYGELPPETRETLLSFESLQEGIKKRDDARKRLGQGAEDFAVAAMETAFMTTKRGDDGELYITETTPAKLMRLLSASEAAVTEGLVMPSVDFLGSKVWDGYTPTRDYDRTNFLGRVAASVYNGQLGLDLDLGDAYLGIPGATAQDPGHRWAVTSGLIGSFLFPYEEMAGAPHRAALRAYRGARPVWDLYEGAGTTTRAGRTAQAAAAGAVHPDPVDFIARMVEAGAIEQSKRGVSPLSGLPKDVRADAVDGLRVALGMDEEAVVDLLARTGQANAAVAATHIDNLRRALNNESPAPDSLHANPEYLRVKGSFGAAVEQGSLKPAQANAGMALLEVLAHRAVADGTYESTAQFFNQFELDPRPEVGPLVPEPGTLASGGAAPTFYSAVERAVGGFLGETRKDRLQIDQLLNRLDKEPGVRADEMEFLGLRDWLQEIKRQPERKGFVQGQELRDYLDRSALELEFVRLGDDTSESLAARQAIDTYSLEVHEPADRLRNREHQALGEALGPDGPFVSNTAFRPRTPVRLLRSTGETVTAQPGQLLFEYFDSKPERRAQMGEWVTVDELTERLRGRTDDALGEPINIAPFIEAMEALDASQAKLKELYAAADAAQRPSAMYAYDDALQLPGGEAYQEVLVYGKRRGQPDKRLLEGEYLAPHFDNRGDALLFHLRLNNRKGPDGERVLFVEEVQSDLMTEARRKGMRAADGTFDPVGRVIKMAERDKYQLVDEGEQGTFIAKQLDGILYEVQGTRKPPMSGTQSGMPKGQYMSWRAFIQGTSKYREAASVEPVPYAPLRPHWHKTALKQVLRDAAVGGYDAISWTTGLQQAERYNVGGRVEHLAWDLDFVSDIDTSFSVEVDEDGHIEVETRIEFSDDKEIELVGQLRNGEALRLGEVNPTNLHEYVDAETTEKLLNKLAVYKTRLTEAVEAEVEDFKSFMKLRKLTPKERLDYAAENNVEIPRARIEDEDGSIVEYFDAIEDAELKAADFYYDVNVNVVELTEAERIEILELADWPYWIVVPEPKWVLDENYYLRNQRDAEQHIQGQFESYNDQLIDPAVESFPDDALRLDLPEDAPPQMVKGFESLYDRAIPKWLKRYTKRHGTRPTRVEMDFDGEPGTVNYLKITDSLRESVLAGQPLFQRDEKTRRARGAFQRRLQEPDAKVTAKELLQELKRINLVSSKRVLEVLGDRPETLAPIITFMAEQRDKLLNGEISARDVAKAYLMTTASQGSGAIRVPTLTAKTGFVPDEFFSYEKPKPELGRGIRPEEAVAAWLMSEAGIAALDELEGGTFNRKSWEPLAEIRSAFGDDRINNLGVLGTGSGKTLRDIEAVTAEINAANGDPKKINKAVRELSGIAHVKSPFLMHLLGFGDSVTLDAVEVNFWLTGQGRIGKLTGHKAAMARYLKGRLTSSQLHQELSRRIHQRLMAVRREHGIGLDIPAELFNHIMHQWIWDNAVGRRTTQQGMMKAMAFASPEDALRGTGAVQERLDLGYDHGRLLTPDQRRELVASQSFFVPDDDSYYVEARGKGFALVSRADGQDVGLYSSKAAAVDAGAERSVKEGLLGRPTPHDADSSPVRVGPLVQGQTIHEANRAIQHADVEYLAAWSEGKPLLRKRGAKRSVDPTTEEWNRMRRARGVEGTHNHPGNKIFSVADVITALAVGMRRFSATNVNGRVWTLTLPDRPDLTSSLADARGLFDRDNPRHRTNADLEAIARDLHDMNEETRDAAFKVIKTQEQALGRPLSYDEKWEILNARRQKGFQAVLDRHVRGSTVQASAPRRHPHGLVASVGRRGAQVRQAAAGVGGPVRERSRVPSESRRLGARGPRRTGLDQGAVAQQLSFLSSNPDSRVQVLSVELAKTLDVALPETSIEVPDTEPPIRGPADPFGFSASASRIYELAQSDDPLVLSQLDELLLALPSDVAAEGRLALQLANAKALIISTRPFVVDVDVDVDHTVIVDSMRGLGRRLPNVQPLVSFLDHEIRAARRLPLEVGSRAEQATRDSLIYHLKQAQQTVYEEWISRDAAIRSPDDPFALSEIEQQAESLARLLLHTDESHVAQGQELLSQMPDAVQRAVYETVYETKLAGQLRTDIKEVTEYIADLEERDADDVRVTYAVLLGEYYAGFLSDKVKVTPGQLSRIEAAGLSDALHEFIGELEYIAEQFGEEGWQDYGENRTSLGDAQQFYDLAAEAYRLDADIKGTPTPPLAEVGETLANLLSLGEMDYHPYFPDDYEYSFRPDYEPDEDYPERVIRVGLHAEEIEKLAADGVDVAKLQALHELLNSTDEATRIQGEELAQLLPDTQPYLDRLSFVVDADSHGYSPEWLTLLDYNLAVHHPEWDIDIGRAGTDDRIVVTVYPRPNRGPAADPSLIRSPADPFRKDKLVELVTAGHTDQAKALSDALGVPLDLGGADLGGADLRGANLSGADLRDVDLGEADVIDANLSGADLRGASLRGTGLDDADLSGADLSGADLSAADLRSANLRGANLSGVSLAKADLWEAQLGGADLTGADLRGARLWDSNLSGTNLSGANISGANLTDADLDGIYYDAQTQWPSGFTPPESAPEPPARPSLIRSPADPFRKDKLVELVKAGQASQARELSQALGIPLDLSGADFSGVNLYGANLSGTNLSGANLSDAEASRADLSGADLTGADLRDTWLWGTNLSGADLSKANLSDAVLTGANLERAILSGANLSADIRYTKLWEADLSGADLSKANLFGAKLDDVYYDDATVWPAGFTPPESAAQPPVRKATISDADDPFMQVKTLSLYGKAPRQYRIAADGQTVESFREWTKDGQQKSAWRPVKNLETINRVREEFDPEKKREGEQRRAMQAAQAVEDAKQAETAAQLAAQQEAQEIAGWNALLAASRAAQTEPQMLAAGADFAAELAQRTVADPAQRELYAENFRQWWRQSAVVDADGDPLQVYHGTSRADRIEGPSRFIKERATSGPMAFFTTDPALASSYTSKSDNSLDFDGVSYDEHFTIRGKSGRKGWRFAWWALPVQMRDYIVSEGFRVARDPMSGEFVFEADSPSGQISKRHWQYKLREHRDNGFAALWDTWWGGGLLARGDEGDFLDVLQLLGIKDATFNDPKAPRGGIFPVYLSIQKPLRTDDIPAEVVDALDAASREPSAQPSLEQGWGADQWDKRTMDPKEWVRRLRDDLVDGVNSFVWTRIPDWVTETLQGLGYDGIQDTGGKMGGDPHTVWIPFEEPQVKSVFNQGRWSREDGNIIRSPDDPFMREKLVELIKVGRAAQAVELMRSFEAPLDLSGADFSGDNIGNVDLSGAILSETSFNDVNLSGANLSGADLRSTTMSEVFAPQANFSGADLRESQLDFQNFRDADLTDADFSWSKIFFSTTEGAVLKGARFFGAVVRSSSFKNSDLTGADLTNADFSFDYKGFFVIENSFEGSNLSNAKMFGANLRSVDFTKADLTGADLRNADLRGATFRGATGLDSAQLDGIYYDGEDPDTGSVVAWPDGFEPPPSADAPAHMRGLISDPADPSLIRSPDDPFREAQAVARLEQHRTAIEHLRGLHEYLSHEDPAQRAYGHEILHTIAPQLAGSLPVEFGQRVAQLSIANLQRLLIRRRQMGLPDKDDRFDALSYLPEPEVMKGPGALDAAVKGLEAMRYDALTGEQVWRFGDVYARLIDLYLPRLQAIRELYQGRHALPIKQEQIASAVELQLQQAGLPEVLDFSTAVVDFYSDGLGHVLLAGPAREDPSLQRRVLAAIGTDFIVRGPYPSVIDGQSSSALSISLRDSDATRITDEGTLNWLADRAARGLIRDADDPFTIDFYGTGTQVALLDVPTREAKGDKPRARRRRRGPSAIVRTRQANLPLPPAKTVRDFAGRLTTPAQLTFPVGSGVGGGFNVLSLFDGISTARQAMHNIGLPVSRYIAAEIDRSAIAVTKDRWPNTEHVGDVQALTPETVGLVDILVGGSPCQDLRPGRKGLKGSKSKLFWEYARLFEEASPRFFLFENTAHISKKDARTVSRVFGVDPIQLDSALVSGQTRKRYFWTNIPGIQQPDQLGVKMPDVILTLSQAQALGYDQIGPPLQASTIAGLQKQVGKTPEVTRFKRYHFPIKEKSRTLKAAMGSRGGDTMLQDGTYRRISRVEAERLQGLPDDYTSAASQGQAIKGIGNAFTVQVIEHILSHIATGDIDRGIYRGGLIRSPDDPFAKPTDTPAFRQWFGDSKVVDEDGSPRVMYHATNADFDQFKVQHPEWSNAFWFGDTPEDLPVGHQLHGPGKKTVVTDPTDGQTYPAGHNIMPVYLKLENPLIRRHVDGDMAVILDEMDVATLREQGHDGIIWRREEGELDEYIVFDPTQIKSATGNIGTFDPTDPSLIRSPDDPFLKEKMVALAESGRDGVAQAVELTRALGVPLDLSGADLGRSGLLIVDQNLSGANFSEANLSGAMVARTDLRGANFSEANLSGAYLYGTDLRDANFYKTNLQGADLQQSDFRSASLRKAFLSTARFSKANLSGADLTGANLSRAGLDSADLSGADLSDAKLIRANLSGANLSGADLSGANLTDANFSEANLSGADLGGADLSYADLSGANLSEANLDGVYYDDTAVWPSAFEPPESAPEPPARPSLIRSPDDPFAVPRMVELLSSPDPFVRAQGEELLHSLPSLSRRVEDQLAKELFKTDLLKDLLTGESKPQHMVFQDAATSLAFHLGLLYNGVGPGGIAHRSRPALRGLQRFLPSLLDASERIIKSNRRFIVAERVNGHGPGTAMFAIEQLVKLDGRARQVLAILNGQEPVDSLTIGEWWSSQEAEVTYSEQLVNIHFAGKPAQPPVLLAHEFAKAHPANAGDFDFNGATDDNVLVNAGFLPVIHPLGMIRDADDPFAKTKATPKRAFTIEKSGPKNVPPVVREWAVEAWQQSLAGKTAWTAAKVRDLSKRLLVAHKNLKGMRAAELRAEAERIATTSLQRHLKYSRRPGTWSPAEVVYGPNSNEAVNNAMMPAFVAYEQTIQSRGASPRVVRSAVAKLAKTLGVDLKERLSAQRWTHEEVRLPNGKTKRVPRAFVVLQRDTNSPLDATTYPTRAEAVAAIKTKSPAEKRNLKPVPKPAELSDLSSDDLDLLARDIAYRSLRVAAPGGVPMPMTTAVPGSRQSDALAWWQKSTAKKPPTVRMVRSLLRKLGLKESSPEFQAAKPRSVAGVDLKAMPEAALSKLGSALLKEARKAERALSAPKETTRKNAALSFANVDEVKARTNGQALRDPAVWQQAMAEITGEDHVLDAPVRAMELVGEPTKIAGVHQGLTAGQRRDVIAGMRISDEFAESYAEGSVSPVESALLLLWGSLSKRLSPYPHEAGFLDAVVDGIVPHIEAAIAGNFDLKAFQSWATKTTRSMSQRGSPGVQTTGNLNAFGEGLLLKMSAEYKPGVSFLQHFHNLVSDPNLSGTEVRRRFFSEMPEKVGINAKVLSFILLVAGKRDLLVLDRVQIRHLWGGEAKAEQYGTPNPYEAWAPPADPLERDPANWGSWASSSGPGTFMVDARGLAIYELIEDSLSEVIEPLIARGDLPEGYSLGQFHWESWVYESAQEVSHGTLEAILKLASGEQDPFLGASVREGKYDTKASGFEYAVVDQEGTRSFIVELSNGDKVEMNRPALKGYLKLVDSYLGKISRKTGIKFNVSESTTEPWFERPEVDRAELDKFIREQLTDTSKGKQARLRPDSASEAAVQDADADSPRGPRGVISSPDDPFLIDNLVNMLELALVSGDPARISDVESKLAKASENARAAVLERVPHYRPEPAKGVTTGGPADSRYSRDKDDRVRGQFQTADLTNVITLFKNGDFNTFLHESGHLLEELMPADEYQSMVSVFESANGKLTPNGQEQLADAFMWYLRTRKAADGRVWAVLSKVELLMRRLWLAVKRQRTDVLPEAAVEVWDQWLRPDLVLDNEVVEVTAKAGTKLLPTVVLPEKGRIDDSIRGALLKESRENRAKRLPWRRDELLQQTRLKPGDEVTINEALARVLGVVAAERTRRSLGSSGLSDRAPVVMTTRSVVPAARARSIAKQAQARMLEALDLSASEMRALLKATTDNRVTLTNAQQAGLRRLASQVATEPMGRSVDKRLLDDNADLSSVSLEEINSLQEALIDTIAGPASGRSREAESVPSTVGFAVARALGKLPSAYWPKLAELQKSLSDAFVLKQPLEGKVDPMIAELVDARSRELGTVDEWIRRKARELQTSGAASLRAVLEGLREQLTAPVAVESLSHISSLLDLFHGQQRAFLVKDLLNETTLNMVDTVLNHGPGKSALERVAVNTLQGYLSVPFEKMSEADQRLVIEAVGVVVDGTRRRAKLVEQRGRDIATCLLGKEKSLSGIKPAQFRELYEAFYKGHWTGADLKLEQQAMTLAKFAANHGVTDYSLEFALVEMIARLRAREVLAGMASDLSRHGLLMDDETIASMAGQELTEVPPQVTDYLDRNRSKSAVDAEGDSLDDRERTEFSRQVKHYLNAILTRPERVLDDQGAVLGAMDIPTPSDAGHALEAYNVATSILARYGISPQSGVKWVSAVMPDGSRALMPANVNAKLKAALNRNTPIGELAKLPGGVLGEVANGLLETLFSTDRNIKMGLTTGNLIPNPAYYTGCFVGMVFQVHQGMGAVGGVRASGSEPRMCVAVTRRLWGHGHRIGEGRAMMTRDGRVYTADMLADLSQRYGLDSSLVQSESAIPLLKDIKRLHATGFQKFASHLRAWQEVLVEAATALDNYFRVAMFIDKLKQGESPDAAAAFARRVGYDYNSLTSFEKKTLRRAVLFYSFIKLNLVFLLDTLLRNPGRFMAQMRLLRGLQREHTEEDPQIVLPDWSNARLIVGSRNAQAQADLYRNSADIAVVDGYVRMLPAIGAPDAYNLLLDLYDAGSSMGTDQEAMHSLLKNLHPVGQALIVGGLGVDPFTGRGVESGKNEMPTWMVEFDQSLFDGELRRTFGAQLTRDKYGRMVYVVDREDKARAWWMLTNLGAFVPGLGRSMDTITQFDRTDLGLLELAARTAATVADEPDPGMLEGPRPGRSRAEEAAELFGVKTVPVPELGHVQDRVFDEEMRRLSDEKRRLDKGSLY